jgi:hypothetical protein
MESIERRKLDAPAERLLELIGTIGFVALGFVLGVVSWFMLKAAIDYNAGKVVSLGGGDVTPRGQRLRHVAPDRLSRPG